MNRHPSRLSHTFCSSEERERRKNNFAMSTPISVTVLLTFTSVSAGYAESHQLDDINRNVLKRLRDVISMEPLFWTGSRDTI